MTILINDEQLMKKLQIEAWNPSCQKRKKRLLIKRGFKIFSSKKTENRTAIKIFFCYVLFINRFVTEVH